MIKGNTDKIDYIDFLRGLAVLGVVATHATMGQGDFPLAKVAALGAKGVQLFYIVSAYTLLLSYQRRHDERTPLLNFAIRRIFRIAPMFYCAIIFYLWLYFDVPYDISDYRYVTHLNIASHFLFLHGLSPYWENSIVPGGWSVAVEMLFYVTFPWLANRVRSSGAALKFYTLALISCQVIVVFMQKFPLIPNGDNWTEFVYISFVAQFPVFIVGFFIYYIRDVEPKRLFQLYAWFIVINLSIALMDRLTHEDLLLANNAIVGMAFATFIILLHRFTLPEWWLTKGVRWLGKLSFSIYLTHFAFQYLGERVRFLEPTSYATLNYLVRFSFVLTGSVMLSAFTFKFIEEPFRRFGSTLIAHFKTCGSAATRSQ